MFAQVANDGARHKLSHKTKPDTRPLLAYCELKSCCRKHGSIADLGVSWDRPRIEVQMAGER